MTRVKKSRKVGSAGSRPATRDRSQDTTSRSLKQGKRNKGRPAGSRHSAVAIKKGGSSRVSQAEDKRLGSRKPISLELSTSSAESAAQPSNPPSVHPSFPTLPADPELALEFIEEHAEFNRLADLVDDGATLSSTEQTLFDWFVEQHQQLAEQLGIADDQDEHASDGERDLLQELEQGEEWLKQHGSGDKP